VESNASGGAAALPFSALLREHRQEAGLTQEALAARAGLSPRSIRSLERGASRPYRDTVGRLVRALSLPPAAAAALAAAAQEVPPPAARGAPPALFVVPGRLAPDRDGGPASPWGTPDARSTPLRDGEGRPPGPRREPPLPPVPHNLPAPLTVLVGREEELAEVARRLAGPAGPRLLTLTGPGGSGKTRLALAVAARLAGTAPAAGATGDEERPADPPDGWSEIAPSGAPGGVPEGWPYPDGVWLAELAALADPDLVPQETAAAVGVREAAGRPLTDTLCRALRDRRLLLVLDNCEHLLEACAALAAALLRSCSGVRVLATSRRPLGLAGEATWWVPPLAWPAGPAGEELPPAALPPPEELLGYGAVQLFVERARDARAAFALTAANAPAVVQICARLDGLPLALELAARQTVVLPPAALAARLDARLRLLTGGGPAAHPRQRTLAATLDWSHALLGESERVLLRRLAVFAGGWTLEAAEAVGADGPTGGPGGPEGAGAADPGTPAGAARWEGLPAGAVLEALRRLVDQSLVVADPSADAARFRFLETVRQYAAERLAEAGEAEAEEVRARHAAWAAGLAERASPSLLAHDQLEWLARLDVEQDNLRAALGWGLRRDPAVALRLAGRLWPYWRQRERHTEGRRWLTDAVAGGLQHSADWARAALGAGILARDLGDGAAARAHLEASLERARALGEQELAAWALRDLGQLHVQQGELEAAEALLAEGLALARAAGDDRGAGAALMIRAQAATLGGDAGRARALNEESLAAARRAGDRWLLSSVLLQLGSAAVDQGDFRAAPPLLEEGLAVTGELGMPSRQGQYQWQLGRLALAQGDLARAVPLLEALRVAALVRDSPRGVSEALADLGRAAHARGEPAEAAALLGEALRLRHGLGERPGIVECLEGLAAVAAGSDPVRAARLLGATAAERRALGTPPPPIRRPDLAAAEHAARATLGPEAYAAARATGEALTLEQAVAEALQEVRPGAPWGPGAS
jgi:predicted ATPase/transcriptional regulator with XRE-family HTH domain